MSLLIVHTLKAFSKVPQYLPASAPASYALATTDDSPCRHPLACASTLQTLAESLGLVPGTQITELRVQGRKERDTRGRCLAQGPGPAGRWGPCSRVDTPCGHTDTPPSVAGLTSPDQHRSRSRSWYLLQAPYLNPQPGGCYLSLHPGWGLTPAPQSTPLPPPQDHTAALSPSIHAACCHPGPSSEGIVLKSSTPLCTPWTGT